MLNPYHLDPSTKALVVSTVFAAAGVIGWLLANAQLTDAALSMPLLVFYATLTINTYSSIKFFSAIIPTDDVVQRWLDFVLVLIYLTLACSLGKPLWFFFMALFLFIVAPIKYSCLLGRIPHPNLLKRKPSDEIAWGSKGKDALYLHKLRRCLSKAGDKDRKILLSVAQKLAAGRNRVAQT